MAARPPLHRRRSTRWPGFDYAQPGAYFITCCTHAGRPLFGRIHGGIMHGNTFGHIVAEEWHRTPLLRPAVQVDAFVVMPNHIHGILVITDPPTPPLPGIPPDPGTRTGMACHAPPTDGQQPENAGTARHAPIGAFGQPEGGALPAIVGAFKSAVAKRINRQRGTPGAAVWQRNYWERVIRSEREWATVRRYIAENPARWMQGR